MQYPSVIWRWRWLVVGGVLVATVGTYALSKVATKQYRAQAQVQARARSVDTALTGSSDQGLTDTQNLAAAVALHVTHYNFCRVHSSLRFTPAMAAGVADRVWGLDELLMAI